MDIVMAFNIGMLTGILLSGLLALGLWMVLRKKPASPRDFIATANPIEDENKDHDHMAMPPRKHVVKFQCSIPECKIRTIHSHAEALCQRLREDRSK